MRENIEHNGVRLATVIRASETLAGTRFITPDDSTMQIGLLMRGAGEIIEAHAHKKNVRTVNDVQEAVLVQSGRVEVDFVDAQGQILKTLSLSAGDAALLADVPLAVRIIEDARCILVKQGPFLGPDKVPIK